MIQVFNCCMVLMSSMLGEARFSQRVIINKHMLIHLFVWSFMHSSIHPFIHSSSHEFIMSFMFSFFDPRLMCVLVSLFISLCCSLLLCVFLFSCVVLSLFSSSFFNYVIIHMGVVFLVVCCWLCIDVLFGYVFLYLLVLTCYVLQVFN